MDRKKDQNSLSELCWVTTGELQNEVIRTLFSNTNGFEESGLLGLIYGGRGYRRRSLFLKEIIGQENGWVYDGNHGLSFSNKYFSRALDKASVSPPGAGIIIVHSHPFQTEDISRPPRPSRPDLKYEKELLFYLSKSLPYKTPLASGIITPNGAWRVREYSWERPNLPPQEVTHKSPVQDFSYQDAEIIRIISQNKVDVIHHNSVSFPNFDRKAQDSTVRLWGEDGQRILGNFRVGISGLGGVGSILTELLSRLGIGELVLVDFDVVEAENLNRLLGARVKDIGRPKIDYLTKLARKATTNKNFKVYAFRESVSENKGINKLLDTDIIMNAADSAFARQVLDHASYSYEIPVIDGGTIFISSNSIANMVGKSQVSVAGPGLPCMECSGVYTQEKATQEREDISLYNDESYIKARGTPDTVPPRNPSVISYNGLVASIMTQRLLSLVLGFPPERKTGQQRYYVEEGILNWGPIDRCRDDCPKNTWVGLGESHYIPTGVDLNRQKMRKE